MGAPKCYTQAELNGFICQALCRHDGADDGQWSQKTGKCGCISEKDFKEFTEPVAIIPGPG